MDKHQVNKLDWDNFRIQTIKQVGKDNLIKYILNEKNRVITKDYIKNALYNYGIDYTPKNMKLFEIAMTHPSYIYKDWTDLKNFKMIFMSINVVGGDMLVPISKEQVNMAVPLGMTSYERLEFLGDSILRLIISDYLFIRYEEMQEGELTKLRSQLENGSSLAEMTRKIGLNKYVLISRNHEVIKGREKNEKIQCDIFEAFIAALFLDACCITHDEICKIGMIEKGNNKINCYDLISRNRGNGYQKCYDFVVSLIEDEIDLTKLLETDTNYKDKLLQYYHELGWGDPTYGTMDTIIDNNKMGKKYFKMYVRDNDKNIIGWGIGSSKEKGEKIAAKRALQNLIVIPNDNEEEILDKTDNRIFHKKTQITDNKNKQIFMPL
jgi:dsRNA-specific ribonuclease